MGTKAKVALLVLMIGLVVAIIVWDKKVGTTDGTKPVEGVAVASNPPPEDPFATPLAPATPETPADPPSTSPFTAPPTPAPPPPAVETTKPATPTGRSPFETAPAPTGNPFDVGTTTTDPLRDPLAVKPPPAEPRRDVFGAGLTPPPPAGSKVHKVKDGETLWDLAEEYYRNGTKWKVIEEANKEKLGSGGWLKVGMDLVIPELTSSSLPATAAATPTAGPGEYKVKSGDTLSTIAKDQLGAEHLWELIAKANEDKLAGRPNVLKVGTVLRIPPKPEKADKPSRTILPKPGTQPDLKEEPVPTDLAGKRTYRIKSGDSLWKIAERELGDGLKWEKLYEANKSRLPSKTDLKVGQVIALPD